MLDAARAVDQHAYLATYVTRELRERSGEIVGHEAVFAESTSAEPLEGLDLARFEAGGVAVDLDGGLLGIWVLGMGERAGVWD